MSLAIVEGHRKTNTFFNCNNSHYFATVGKIALVFYVFSWNYSLEKSGLDWKHQWKRGFILGVAGSNDPKLFRSNTGPNFRIKQL